VPGIPQLVTAISNDVVAKLAAAGYPPLIDGQIVLGRVHVAENTSAPRIVFVPKGSVFGPKDPASRSAISSSSAGFGVRRVELSSYGAGYTSAPTVTLSGAYGSGTGAVAIANVNTLAGVVTSVTMSVTGSGYQTPISVSISGGGGSGAQASAVPEPPSDWRTIFQWRSVATDEIVFEVNCWGVQYTNGQPNPDPNTGGDFNFTQALYQQVVTSVHDLCAGICKFGPGQWVDQLPNSTQLVKFGSWYRFTVSIMTPVLDVLLPYVPTGTVSANTLTLNASTYSGDAISVSP
jgi:hypothetical protein